MKEKILKWGGVVLCFSLGFSVFFQLGERGLQAGVAKPNASYDFSIPSVQQIDPSCPFPTQPEDGECVLEGEVVLTKTLVLSSGTTLRCKEDKDGKKGLTPSIEGQSAAWGWNRRGNPFQPSVPSTPSTAVLLSGETSNATVENCKIEKFDFGIVIANSKLRNAGKTGTLNRIINNSIDVRYRGVEIIASDGNVVQGNTIHAFAAASGGVSITHDSDDNLVTGNTYVGPSVEEWVPGPNFPGGQDEFGTFNWSGEGVRVLGPAFSYNFKVGKKLFVGTKDYDKQAERNVIEANDIDIPNRLGNGLVAESLSDRTVFRCNVVHQAADGIACVGHASGANPPSLNVLIEGNTIDGPVESGFLAANTQNPVYRNNIVKNATFAGAFLIFQSNAIFTGNVISDSAVGLELLAVVEGGLHVSANDFIDNGLQVEAFELGPLELSVEGIGNYWGHPGWLESDTNEPELVRDSFPSDDPVADSPDCDNDSP
jgi:Nitrous oxidase accessory protein